MPCIDNNVFWKFNFGLSLIYFIILEICFENYVDCTKIGLNSDTFSYEEKQKILDVSHIISDHFLQKPASIDNTTVTSTDHSLAESSTILATVADVESVTSKVPNTQPSRTLHGSDNEDDDYDFKLEGNNASTVAKFEYHRYYRSYSETGMEAVVQYWVDLDSLPQENVVSLDFLSDGFGRALTVSLTFDFPFYGDTLRNITIAMGGFLSTATFSHKWLAATQYIAPLMANFDTSISPEATVKYTDNGTALTVQWEKVLLQNNPEVGSFTFQVTIHQTGKIIFVYKDIPVFVTQINDMERSVKVGLSDAYLVERTIFYVRRKTVYEYHKIDMKKRVQIGNWTAIVFEPLPVCLSFNSCDACLTAKTNFECQWCPEVGRCSDGSDRHRQAWLEGGCVHTAVFTASFCAYLPQPTPSTTVMLVTEPMGETSLDSNSTADNFLQTPASMDNTTIISLPENVTSEVPNTQPSSSTYGPDNGYDDDFKSKGFNASAVAKFDYHRYYRSYSNTGMEEVAQYWVDLDSLPQENVVSLDSLSSGYRKTLTVTLTFDFPFYGYSLRNITITVGGFLFTGPYLNEWLTFTEYIAPLMANFNASISPEATIKYVDNGTSLTVQWEKVVLQDNPKVGSFTFQVTIHHTGKIIFAYKNIPVIVTLIEHVEHPVKVGISDAYIVENTVFSIRKKTTYAYHKINMKKAVKIGNWTAIVFEPLPLCVSFNSCDTCLRGETNFKCKWCPEVGRCSDGLDRRRQDWLDGGCESSAVSNISLCAHLTLLTPSPAFKAVTGPMGAASVDSNSTADYFPQKTTLMDNTTITSADDSLVTSEIPSTHPPNSFIGSDIGNDDDDDFKLEGFNSSTMAKFDNHRYYRSYSKTGMQEVVQYWVDFDTLPEEKVVSDDSLSNAHRRALTVSLTFDFPFYGHTLRNVTITTGGFLFTGWFLHTWLAATQYIAPLMANFDPSISPEASVKYTDNGTSLTVQWEKVLLQNNPEVGSFTFQVTIHQSGKIIFVYKDIPVNVTQIKTSEHPVKVGLSDAYILQETSFYSRKKNIYEYNKIDMKKGMQIGNWTAIVFEPLAVCVSFNSCNVCLTAKTDFKCKWCPEIGRCSDGLDRHRQDWLDGECESSAVSNISLCAHLTLLTPSPAFNTVTRPMGAASVDSNSTADYFPQKTTLMDNTTITSADDSLVTSEIPSTHPPNSFIGSDSGNDDDNDFKLEGFNSSTMAKFDNHRYYRSYSKTGMQEVVQYWVDFDTLPEEKVVSDDSLSNAHRRALTVSLTFDFPFYGHTLRNVTITTGGFLFTGWFLHTWLAATQYIAPLMANFDPSISPEASVKYTDNGTSLTVQWEKVLLQNNPEVGSFTFQVTIHQSGKIIFVYKDIPVNVTQIKTSEHPVKVGLSDAYILQETSFYSRKKNIYEYNKIDMKKGMQIGNWTAIVFEPLPVCVSFNSCNVCLTAKTDFKCKWCHEVGRCSDGLDRHHQDWLDRECESSAVSNTSLCAHLNSKSVSDDDILIQQQQIFNSI